jgi:putative PIN family toxin of toxin-antitoxin system
LGKPARIVAAAEEERYELVLSNLVLEELKRVLMRPKFRRYVPEEAVELYLTRVMKAAHMMVEQSPSTERWLERSPDPKDDYLIDLVLNSASSVLVSGDRHLLDLETAPTGGISTPIFTPHEFLEQLKRSE